MLGTPLQQEQSQKSMCFPQGIYYLIEETVHVHEKKMSAIVRQLVKVVRNMYSVLP